MEYLYPVYYKEFGCIAGVCEDTCCAGWQIVIDEKNFEKYLKTEGNFGNRLKNCINVTEKCFAQCGDRCAFLNDDNLCDLYMELGEDALCDTCKNYPRHIEEFLNVREVTLSLSCPEACRLILGQTNTFDYYVETDDLFETEEFNSLLFSKLDDCREYCMKLLESRELSIWERLAVILVFSHDVQRRIQMDAIDDIDLLLYKYEQSHTTGKLINKFSSFKRNDYDAMTWLSDLEDYYTRLEPLKDTWFQLLEEVFGFEKEHFGNECTEFFHDYIPYQMELENITKTLLFTYYCGGVYDYDILSKVKFVVLSAIVITMTDVSAWNKQGRIFTKEMQVDLVHRYSREIEHSEINLNRLESMLKTKHHFHYKKILEMLMWFHGKQ